ncbi:MAG: proteasome assembly chaperone family protein [Methanocellales archaeon]|nr:proteasome assembly chaperone family protein [Methanocellales archaeon]MDD3290961.1 proteasome assembly chaperone family protein [Methanocellales archaeon]MDD5234846.1 proteasome assembly chaperone family protein [Methanocellales archaeon]MDD5484784.1 proteasome assembly chaperone family protein [Methanocellales archaeon]
METSIVQIKDVILKNPIMIEGLPGIGHVGKLVAEHMVEELGAEKIIEIYSSHFPPQVLVMKDGTVELAKNEVYAWSGGKHDLLLLVGAYQSTTNVGHYELTGVYLDIAQKYGVKRIYTLGGYGVGHLVERPRVLGAVNNIALVDEMKKYGVSFEEDEPGGGIIGASGLLLGMGRQRGIDAICLMGETSGYLVDPESAQAVLKSLSKALGMKIDMRALEDRAKEMEKIIARLREMEQGPAIEPIEEDLSYIG